MYIHMLRSPHSSPLLELSESLHIIFLYVMLNMLITSKRQLNNNLLKS